MYSCSQARPWTLQRGEFRTTPEPVPADGFMLVPRVRSHLRFRRRHVLLRVCYLGWDYQGLASQEDTPHTIEAELFRALQLTKLVAERQTSNYHRCGRTDKVRPLTAEGAPGAEHQCYPSHGCTDKVRSLSAGMCQRKVYDARDRVCGARGKVCNSVLFPRQGVSAFSQVVSLDVRSQQRVDPEEPDAPASLEPADEINYTHILNKGGAGANQISTILPLCKAMCGS